MDRALERSTPFTDVYGLARTLLAVSTASTLLFSQSTSLFCPVSGHAKVPICEKYARLGFFCFVSSDKLEAARWGCFALLLLVASGWRPRATGILHAWLAYSLQANAVLVEGGDQLASILSILLVPVTLSDSRKWHWSADCLASDFSAVMRRAVATSALWMVRIQVSVVYLEASVGKLMVAEWVDGTAVYYWLNDPTFGAPGWLRPVLRPLLTSSGVAVVTWGVILIELFLAASLVMRKRFWPWMLCLGVTLHASIALLHGLVSFSIIMTGALILYLRPVDQSLHIAMRLRHALTTFRSYLAAGSPVPTRDFGRERGFSRGSNER